MIGFRPAKPASFVWNYAKTLIQTICFWGFFLAVIPLFIRLAESALQIQTFERMPLTGIAIFSVASMIGLSAGFVMTRNGKGTPLPPDCPRQLVTAGPYAYVRNPMALAGIVQGIAVGLFLGSWFVVFYSVMGAPVWHWIARPAEEADLVERFGDEYLNYRKHVKLWIPRLTAYQREATSSGDA